MHRPTAEDLLALLALKELPRSGWLQMGLPKAESVADHSWGTSLLVLLLAPEDIDLGRALAMAVLHDLAEIRTGDLTPRDPASPSERRSAGAAAIRGLLGDLSRGQALIALWDAFEDGRDPEARFVRQLDKLEVALQALRYGREGAPVDLTEFVVSSRLRIADPDLLALLDAQDSGGGPARRPL
jgi:putative hydrolases of HD superfamily